MTEEKNMTNQNEIAKLFELYDKVLANNSKLEDLNLIEKFFQPLRVILKQGRYDYDVVKAWLSASNLLDLKVQHLLDKTLQRKKVRGPDSSIDQDNLLSNAIVISRPIKPLAYPLSKESIVKAFVELMIHRRRKRAYDSKPERMNYIPKEIEPISIEIEKESLLQKIKKFRKASIDFSILLKERTWQEAIEILNILLHLAHERKIRLRQKNFPRGKIIITYLGDKN